MDIFDSQISSEKTFRLRPLSLATENRQTIIDLLVEEFRRLAEVGNSNAEPFGKKLHP